MVPRAEYFATSSEAKGIVTYFRGSRAGCSADCAAPFLVFMQGATGQGQKGSTCLVLEARKVPYEHDYLGTMMMSYGDTERLKKYQL